MQASHRTTPAQSVYRIVASFTLFSALAACGYKGPLYMPPPPPPDASLTTPPATSPSPATGTPNPYQGGTMPPGSNAVPSPIR